jgi:hypothetical protein
MTLAGAAGWPVRKIVVLDAQRVSIGDSPRSPGR